MMEEEVSALPDDKQHQESTNSRTTATVTQHKILSKAHLIVLQHGLHGRASDFEALQERLEKREDIVFLNIGFTDKFSQTHEGIDVGGLLLTQRVENLVEEKKSEIHFKTISFIGHSLGGLYTRYCIGKLYENDFFRKNEITPMMYMSIASPHLGVRPSLISYTVKGDSFGGFLGRLAGKLPSLASIITSKVESIVSYCIGRTGQQLFLQDPEQILKEMSQPDSIYMKGLSQFKLHYLLSNKTEDIQVPYFSSSLILDPEEPKELGPSIQVIEDLSFESALEQMEKQQNHDFTPKGIFLQEELDPKLGTILEIQSNLCSAGFSWRRIHFDFNSVFSHVYSVKHALSTTFIASLISHHFKDLTEEKF